RRRSAPPPAHRAVLPGRATAFLPPRAREILGPMTRLAPAPFRRPAGWHAGAALADAEHQRRALMPLTPAPALVRRFGRVALALALAATTGLADDLAPKADERQLPLAMHSDM